MVPPIIPHPFISHLDFTPPLIIPHPLLSHLDFRLDFRLLCLLVLKHPSPQHIHFLHHLLPFSHGDHYISISITE